MTLYTTIQQATPEGTRSVLLSLAEANYGLDLSTDGTFPVIIVVPPTFKDSTDDFGVIRTKVDLTMFFLDKLVNQPTVDYETPIVDAAITQPMHDLARKLFRNLQKLLTDEGVLDFSEGAIGERTYTPEFGTFDSHLHGLVVSCTVNLIGGIVC